MVYVALCQAIELEKLMNVTPSWFTARAFTALYLIILTRSCTKFALLESSFIHIS
jgi:hypothetical protein